MITKAGGGEIFPAARFLFTVLSGVIAVFRERKNVFAVRVSAFTAFVFKQKF